MLLHQVGATVVRPRLRVRVPAAVSTTLNMMAAAVETSLARARVDAIGLVGLAWAEAVAVAADVVLRAVAPLN